jgi:hypothetical protein
MKDCSRSRICAAHQCLGQHTGQVGAQEILLQLIGIALVLQCSNSSTVMAMLRTASKPSTITARDGADVAAAAGRK